VWWRDGCMVQSDESNFDCVAQGKLITGATFDL
jgi:hypothetical protein